MWEELQIQIVKPSAWIKFGLGLVVSIALYRLGQKVLHWLEPHISRPLFLTLQAFLIVGTLVIFAGLTTQAFYLTSSPFFEMSGQLLQALTATGGKLVVITALAMVAWSLIGAFASRVVPSDEFSRHTVRVRTLKQVIESTLKAVVFFAASIAGLQAIGVNATSLLASASVLGFAVSFGSQNLIKDVVSGFFILLTGEYGVGDDIQVNLGDVVGTVEDLNLRTTSVRALDGTLHVVRNGNISTTSVMSRGWSQVLAVVDVSYDADIDRAIKVLGETCEDFYNDPDWNSQFMAEPAVQGATSLGPSAITLRALLKVQPKAQYAVSREFNRRIKIAMDKAGISLPYPQRQLSFSSEALKVQLVEGAAGSSAAAQKPQNPEQKASAAPAATSPKRPQTQQNQTKQPQSISPWFSPADPSDSRGSG